MKLIITFTALMAVASASSIAYYVSPGVRSYPYVYGGHSSSLSTPVQQQYHSQDDLGQYSYGYSEPLSSKQEVRTLDGLTRGSYSYIDAEGKLQTVDYTADASGFHVAATNLPRSVPAPTFRAQETPAPVAYTDDVAAARAAHFAAHQAAQMRLAKSDTVSVESATGDTSSRSMELRQPVEDTVEVAAAKVEHLKRLEQEKLRNAQSVHGHDFAVVRNALPLAYQSAVIPSIYSYNYPLNSRFLSSGFYY